MLIAFALNGSAANFLVLRKVNVLWNFHSTSSTQFERYIKNRNILDANRAHAYLNPNQRQKTAKDTAIISDKLKEARLSITDNSAPEVNRWT